MRLLSKVATLNTLFALYPHLTVYHKWSLNALIFPVVVDDAYVS